MSLAVPSAHNHLTQRTRSVLLPGCPPWSPTDTETLYHRSLVPGMALRDALIFAPFIFMAAQQGGCCCSHTPQMQAWGHKGRSDFLGFTQLVSFLPNPLAPWSRALVLSEGAGNARALTNPEPVNRCEL